MKSAEEVNSAAAAEAVASVGPEVMVWVMMTSWAVTVVVVDEESRSGARSRDRSGSMVAVLGVRMNRWGALASLRSICGKLKRSYIPSLTIRLK